MVLIVRGSQMDSADQSFNRQMQQQKIKNWTGSFMTAALKQHRTCVGSSRASFQREQRCCFDNVITECSAVQRSEVVLIYRGVSPFATHNVGT